MSSILLTDNGFIEVTATAATRPLFPLDLALTRRRSAVFSVDGSRLVVAVSGLVYIYDTFDYTILETITPNVGTPYCVAISNDNQYIAVGGSSGSRCQVFDSSGGVVASSVPVPTAVQDVAFSPDGALLATAGGPTNGQNVHVYDTSTWSAVPISNTGAITGDGGRTVAFNQAGTKLWAGFKGNTYGSHCAACIDVLTMTASAVGVGILSGWGEAYILPASGTDLAIYYSPALLVALVFDENDQIVEEITPPGALFVTGVVELPNGDLFVAGQGTSYYYTRSDNPLTYTLSYATAPLDPPPTYFAKNSVGATGLLLDGTCLDEAGVGFPAVVQVFDTLTRRRVTTIQADGLGNFSTPIMSDAEILYLVDYKDDTRNAKVGVTTVRQLDVISWQGTPAYAPRAVDEVDFVWEARFLRPHSITSDATMAKYEGGGGLQDTIATGTQDDGSALTLQAPGIIVIKLTEPYITPDPQNDMELMLRGSVELSGTELNISLMQGPAVRQQWLGEVWTPGVIENHKYILSQAAKDSISNWGNLSLKIEVVRNGV